MVVLPSIDGDEESSEVSSSLEHIPNNKSREHKHKHVKHHHSSARNKSERKKKEKREKRDGGEKKEKKLESSNSGVVLFQGFGMGRKLTTSNKTASLNPKSKPSSQSTIKDSRKLSRELSSKALDKTKEKREKKEKKEKREKRESKEKGRKDRHSREKIEEHGKSALSDDSRGQGKVIVHKSPRSRKKKSRSGISGTPSQQMTSQTSSKERHYLSSSSSSLEYTTTATHGTSTSTSHRWHVTSATISDIDSSSNDRIVENAVEKTVIQTDDADRAEDIDTKYPPLTLSLHTRHSSSDEDPGIDAQAEITNGDSISVIIGTDSAVEHQPASVYGPIRSLIHASEQHMDPSLGTDVRPDGVSCGSASFTSPHPHSIGSAKSIVPLDTKRVPSVSFDLTSNMIIPSPKQPSYSTAHGGSNNASPRDDDNELFEKRVNRQILEQQARMEQPNTISGSSGAFDSPGVSIPSSFRTNSNSLESDDGSLTCSSPRESFDMDKVLKAAAFRTCSAQLARPVNHKCVMQDDESYEEEYEEEEEEEGIETAGGQAQVKQLPLPTSITDSSLLTSDHVSLANQQQRKEHGTGAVGMPMTRAKGKSIEGDMGYDGSHAVGQSAVDTVPTTSIPKNSRFLSDHASMSKTQSSHASIGIGFGAGGADTRAVHGRLHPSTIQAHKDPYLVSTGIPASLKPLMSHAGIDIGSSPVEPPYSKKRRKRKKKTQEQDFIN
ncbi:hypothetical protein ADUPG1_010776, partial [Aduncisulcus paluster]